MKRTRGTKKRAISRSVQSTSSESVHNQAAASDCTDSPIYETVQRGAVEVQVQVFRAKMKQYLEGEQVLILGNSWHCRGFVIPVARTWYRSEADRAAHHKRLRAQFEAALQRLND